MLVHRSRSGQEIAKPVLPMAIISGKPIADQSE
jgi:hypothetical protein